MPDDPLPINLAAFQTVLTYEMTISLCRRTEHSLQRPLVQQEPYRIPGAEPVRFQEPLKSAWYENTGENDPYLKPGPRGDPAIMPGGLLDTHPAVPLEAWKPKFTTDDLPFVRDTPILAAAAAPQPLLHRYEEPSYLRATPEKEPYDFMRETERTSRRSLVTTPSEPAFQYKPPEPLTFLFDPVVPIVKDSYDPVRAIGEAQEERSRLLLSVAAKTPELDVTLPEPVFRYQPREPEPLYELPKPKPLVLAETKTAFDVSRFIKSDPVLLPETKPLEFKMPESVVLRVPEEKPYGFEMPKPEPVKLYEPPKPHSPDPFDYNLTGRKKRDPDEWKPPQVFGLEGPGEARVHSPGVLERVRLDFGDSRRPYTHINRDAYPLGDDGLVSNTKPLRSFFTREESHEPVLGLPKKWWER